VNIAISAIRGTFQGISGEEPIVALKSHARIAAMKNQSSITSTVISRLLIFLIFLSVSSAAHGQSQPQQLSPGVPVTGLCQGHETEPGCVLPNLFGPDGLTLATNPIFPHYAHFIGSAQTTINQTVSTAIATQLAVLPIISPSSGFTYKYDSETGAFVRTTTSFGPIFAERAETIGRGKVMMGSSYQRFRFDSLDGISLHSVPAVFSHVPNTGTGNVPEPYEADVITSTNNINVNMDQTMLFGTVGITNRLDVSVAVPIVSVRMGASSNDQIIRVSGPTFTLTGTNTTLPNPHLFPNGTLSNVSYSNGNAAGIGDVTFRVKGDVFQSESVRIALAMDVRTPTGDARQFLGSGATGIKPFFIVSVRKKFSPHANLGYQWNGESILAGNITGTTISEGSTGTAQIQNGPAVKGSLPRQFFGTLGVDFGIPGRRLTLAFDYLGQVLFDAPRVFQTTQTTANIPGGTGALTLPTISGGKDNVVLSSGSAGFKYNLFNNVLLTGNILFRLDNKGLRQNVTPLAALTYSFGQ
jgi:hypothetical protein